MKNITFSYSQINNIQFLQIYVSFQFIISLNLFQYNFHDQIYKNLLLSKNS